MPEEIVIDPAEGFRAGAVGVPRSRHMSVRRPGMILRAFESMLGAFKVIGAYAHDASERRAGASAAVIRRSNGRAIITDEATAPRLAGRET